MTKILFAGSELLGRLRLAGSRGRQEDLFLSSGLCPLECSGALRASQGAASVTAATAINLVRQPS